MALYNFNGITRCRISGAVEADNEEQAWDLIEALEMIDIDDIEILEDEIDILDVKEIKE